MANVSAAYHTIISTCKMHCISALEFFKGFFHEIMLGRRDNENLLPMKICIKLKKKLKIILILTSFVVETSLDGFYCGGDVKFGH